MRFLNTLLTLSMSIVVGLFSTVSAKEKHTTTSRIVLDSVKNNREFILTQQDFSKENTDYIIKQEFDLQGGCIEVPNNCNLIFRRKGKIKNGHVKFNNTWLKSASFSEIHSLKGTVSNRVIYASHFNVLDDTDLLEFLFNHSSPGTCIVLEDRLYDINSLKYCIGGSLYDRAFVMKKGQSDFSIVGNGAVIKDRANKTHISDNLFSLIQFDNCSNVTIKDLSYIWDFKSDIHPFVHGIIFIRTLGQCSGFNIDVSVLNAGRGVYCGAFAYNKDAKRGICDSKIIVKSENVGYPLAIERGDNLELYNYFNVAHRGTYLAGVTNSTVYVEGKDAYSTEVSALLTDTGDINSCEFCDNINLTVVDTGTGLFKNKALLSVCQIYPKSFKQFYARDPYVVSNINIHVYTPSSKSTSYEVFQFTDNAAAGDIINVNIDGNLNDEGPSSRLFRFRMLPLGKVKFKGFRNNVNTIILNSEVPTGFCAEFEDCSNIVFTPQEAYPINGDINFINCSFISYDQLHITNPNINIFEYK